MNQDDINKILLEIRRTNQPMAVGLEKFLNELKQCAPESPEFAELLKLFPGWSFSDVCKRWCKNAGLTK